MSTIKDLARVLALRTQMSQRDAEAFIGDMFDVVKDALNTDGQVKIKGIGMFKLQTVRERESVDVNTGKRVLIASHDRISFTPDTLMKDAVNKPFAHFETVILNDGVSFDDTPEENEAEIDDATSSETTVEEIPETQTVPVLPPVHVEEPASEESAPVEETIVIEEPAPVEETIEESSSVVEESVPVSEVSENVIKVEHETVPDVEPETTPDVGHEATSEPEPEVTPVPEAETKPEQDTEPDAITDDEDNRSAISWPKAIGMTAACFVIFAAGVFVGRITAPQPIPEKPLKVELVDTAKVLVKDTANVQKKDSVAIVAKDTAKNVQATASVNPETTKPTATTKEEAKQSVPDNEKYSYDARVRTGAWVITGTRCEHIVKAGQTLQGISRFYLGDGMECYVEVYNSNIKEVKTGDKIKIPELKNKKQLKK